MSEGFDVGGFVLLLSLEFCYDPGNVTLDLGWLSAAKSIPGCEVWESLENQNRF